MTPQGKARLLCALGLMSAVAGGLWMGVCLWPWFWLWLELPMPTPYFGPLLSLPALVLWPVGRRVSEGRSSPTCRLAGWTGFVLGVLVVLFGGGLALYGFGRGLWALFFEGI
jgi:hypothetical protein